MPHPLINATPFGSVFTEQGDEEGDEGMQRDGSFLENRMWLSNTAGVPALRAFHGDNSRAESSSSSSGSGQTRTFS